MSYNEKNIFCLEGDWETDLRKKTSILAGLEMLNSISDIKYIYKTCGTFEELEFRINNYLGKSKTPKSTYGKYDILYIACHGTKGSIVLDNKEVSIHDLFMSKFGKNQFRNKIIHFGSCKTLNIDVQELEQIKKFTGAKVISGYSKDVDFLASTMLDILYFDKWQNYTQSKSLLSDMEKKHKGMCKDLGFIMV